MYNIFFNKIKKYIIDVNLEDNESLCGSTEKDIIILENSIGKTLPESYKAWLSNFGDKMSFDLFDRMALTMKKINEAENIARKANTNLNYQETLFINYIDYSDAFTILIPNKISDDPSVYTFFPNEKPLKSANFFTSWVRESVINRLKINSKQKGEKWLNKKEWLSIDYYQYTLNNSKTKEYKKLRKEFTSIIESRDYEKGLLTMPDEFQYEFIEYLKQKCFNFQS